MRSRLIVLRTHDLLIMTRNVKALWEEMQQADIAQTRPMEH